jgi:hypothetical protein
MDDYFRRVELNITFDEFHRVPRNPAYKYEYYDGRAVLTPRPKSFTCVRDLGPVESEPQESVTVERLTASEAAGLADLFAAAVRRTQPFESLDSDAARAAADGCLNKTLSGGNGPLIWPACFRATSPKRWKESPVGAILVTLVPPEVLTEPFAGPWKSPPPPNAVERKTGVPHVTWAFVTPWEARRGVGTALLAAAVGALRGMGFDAVASTFLLDNGPSALWHWRNGFRLLSQWSAARKQWRADREA